jgi:murein DD-endopeptidase MepM/ murein hydrolase activator NlpD
MGLGRIPNQYLTPVEPYYQRPMEGRISSQFGMRIHPIKKTKKMHKGLDIAAPKGTPIYPIADGLVSFSGTQSGYGHIVIIDHGEGVTSRYAHCHKRRVKKGKYVRKQDVIATVGKSGTATGYHLHLEIRINNNPIDPQNVISYD